MSASSTLGGHKKTNTTTNVQIYSFNKLSDNKSKPITRKCTTWNH